MTGRMRCAAAGASPLEAGVFLGSSFDDVLIQAS
jgi:hypothetical protein